MSNKVVVRRHIPRDWNTFIMPVGDSRVYVLCGRRSVSRVTGIPGVTQQPIEFKDQPGWCIGCIDAMFEWYRTTYQRIVTLPEVQQAYDIVFWEMFRFMRAAMESKEKWLGS